MGQIRQIGQIGLMGIFYLGALPICPIGRIGHICPIFNALQTDPHRSKLTQRRVRRTRHCEAWYKPWQSPTFNFKNNKGYYRSRYAPS